MTEKQFFPASIVDELTYCVEGVASGLHLVYAWIVTLEGEVSTDVTHRALDRAFDYYPKCKCILVNNYPSYKRWFRYRWEHTEVRGKDIVQEITLSDPDFTIEKTVDYYVHNHVPLSIDISSHIPLKVLLIRTPQRTFFSFIMHHSVADGVGSISFIQKFITYYEDIFYQREPADHHSPRYERYCCPPYPVSMELFLSPSSSPLFQPQQPLPYGTAGQALFP